VHFGYKNKRNSYYLGFSVIKSDIEVKDLGVIVHESLKSTSQCVAAAKLANITLGMIRRTFIDNPSIHLFISGSLAHITQIKYTHTHKQTNKKTRRKLNIIYQS